MRTGGSGGGLPARARDWAAVERRERRRFALQERAVERCRERLVEQGRRLAELRDHNLRLMALRAELMAERLRRRQGLRSRPAVAVGGAPSRVRVIPGRGREGREPGEHRPAGR